jgi:two-component system, sporulation sensor kinase B
MITVNELLLQIFFIICPILIYSTFSKKYKARENGVLRNTLAFYLPVILCMTFGIHVIPGHLFDLRIIPIVLAFLYSGRLSGSIAVLIFLLYRIYIGGAGTVPAIVVVLVSSTFTILLSRRFSQTCYKYKLLIISALMLGNSLTRILVISSFAFQSLLNDFVFHFISFPLLQMLGGILTVALIESYYEKLELEKNGLRSEKIKVAGQLSASIAHEVRNPLTVIKGFLTLYSQTASPERRDYYIETALSEVERAEHIINDYLSIAKPTEDRTARIPVADHLRELENSLQSYALMNNVKLSVTAVHTMYVNADRNKLSQVILNMAKNAIEACTHGNGKVTITAYEDKDHIKIEIEDNGTGIAPEELSKIGDAFFTKKQKGTGLGLMVCYQIVEQMRGKIAVNSMLGKGTTFTIRLPAALL